MTIQKTQKISKSSPLPSLREEQQSFLKGKLKKPYLIDDSIYRPFSSQMIVFSRVVWDDTSKVYGKEIYERLPKIIAQKKPGYSRVDFAAQAASWTVYNHFRGAFSWNRLQQPGRREALGELPQYMPENLKDLTDQVKKVAQFYGASLVGITKLNRRWIYSHGRMGEKIEIPSSIEYAIVIAIEMDDTGIACSPAIPAAIATGNGYSRMAFVQSCLAEFIRNLGYQAIPSGNDTGLSVPLAVDAGLGQFSRMGLLITPEFGPRVRLAKVLTDLPLIPDELDIKFNQSVIRFCKTCKKCAKQCPSKSITREPEPTWTGPSRSNNNGIYKWYVDVESCYNFWNQNGAGCSVCIRVCPYTKNRHWSHGVVRWFIKQMPWLNRLWLWSDDILGYGKKKDPGTFWAHDDYIHTR